MLTSFQKTWGSLSFGQRTLLGVLLAVVLGGILLVGQMAGHPSYAVLYSNLEPEDAGAVTSKLREMKVEYQLSEAGRAIEVPADKVYDLRLTMANDGLPRGSSAGFELFDKTSFGATDFTQHLNYMRALQGELTRTINRLDGVVESRVHLAMPEKRLFSEKEEPSTASVVLHLRPGYQLDPAQVSGIVHLVSSAVEGLKPESVTVYNSQGELLSSAGSSSIHTEDQVQYQVQYEKRLEADLQRLVERVLGPGKAAIRVSADFNWDQSETTSESYRPSGPRNGNLPEEEERSTETYGHGGRPDRGFPGVKSNLQPAPGVRGPDGADSGQYINTHINNHYVVDKVVERRVAAPGKIRKISVAVLLDGSINPAQQSALKNALAAAAGLELDPPAQGGRGDRIELLPMTFDKTAAAEETRTAQQEEKKGFQAQLVRNGASVLVVILVVIGSLLVARQLLAPQPAGSPPRESLEALLNESIPMHAGAPSVGGTPAPADLTYSPGVRQPPAAVDRMRQIAANRPDEVARQIQTWMRD